MTLAGPPPQLPVSDVVDDFAEDLKRPIPQHAQHKFDFDDAFSAHEDAEPASFDFGADILKELELRPTIQAEEEQEDTYGQEDDEAEDMQDSRLPTYDSTDASISTLDIDAPAEPHHSPPATPPHPSSSLHSFNSEEQPPTPPDDSVTSPAEMSSQFTNIALSPPLHSPQHDHISEGEHAYPSVIIDASKGAVSAAPEFPTSISQQTSDSHDSSSSTTSVHAAASVVMSSVPVHDTLHHTTPSMSSTTAQPISPGHRPSPSLSTQPRAKSSGPSAFQKVVSKTRPPYLPPKQKQEDEKHSKEWEEMMERSRIAEHKRREALEARRLARELSVEANTALWERAVMPDWKKAVKDPQLRKLWWDGVPTKLRSVVWERAVGNGLSLSRDSYRSALARAKSLIASKRFPTTALSLLESDIAGTLPQLHIFHHLTGPLYGDLRDLLCAWVVSRADEGLGYVEGVAKIGGMLLLNLTSPAQAFVVMRNMLETGCMRAFYGGAGSRDDVEAYYRIFDTLLADGMPKVYFNFKQHQISPAEYLPDWLLPLFLNHLPLEACSRIWDVLLLEGDAFLLRAALAILASIESRLFFPDRKELMEVLKGESRAALEVAKRGAQSPAASGNGELVVPRYEIYGIDEETIWERLIDMEEWWKESTWQRLIQRELPDL